MEQTNYLSSIQPKNRNINTFFRVKMLENLSIKEIRNLLLGKITLENILEKYELQNNSKATNQVLTYLKYLKFENCERKRFLEKYYPYTEVGVFLRNFDKDNHPLVIQATDKGITNGVDDFLIRNNSKNLYLAKIIDFVYDETVQHTIETELEKLKLGIKEISLYSNNVRKRYALFIYNDSLRKFAKKFEK